MNGGFGGSMHEEDALGKAYDARLMKRLIHYLGPYKRLAAMGLLLTLLGAALGPAVPYIIRVAIDGPITHGSVPDVLNKAPFLDQLTWLTVIMLGLLILTFIFRRSQTVTLNKMGQSAMYDLRCKLFSHLEKMDVSYHTKNPVGRLVTRVTNDIEALNELFSSGIITVVGDILQIVFITSLMFWFNWQLTLVVLSVVPFLAVVAILFRKKARECYRNVRVKLARINAYLQENITGMRVIQIFLREERNLRKFKKINSEYRAETVKTVRYYALFHPAVEILWSIATAGVVYFGGLLILDPGGSFTVGEFIFFWMLIGQIFEPISDLSEKYNILQAAMASSERVFSILDTPPDIRDDENAVEPENIEGAIEFRNVTFSYTDSVNVIEDVSFKVAPGEKIALVGSTGGGKTTIASLIMRFYDVTSGEVLIDGIDVRKYDQRALRRNFGLVLQDVFLFTGTILENLRLSDESIPLERVEQSAKDVNAAPFIRKLDGEFDAKVMERGATFSTGEKQLLSFARALVFDPRILILDEATSSVDPQTEEIIQQALSRLMTGRTAVVIAHRLSTIKQVDRILVIHKGRIAEEGSHQELLAKRGIYWKLYQLQYAEEKTVR